MTLDIEMDMKYLISQYQAVNISPFVRQVGIAPIYLLQRPLRVRNVIYLTPVIPFQLCILPARRWIRSIGRRTRDGAVFYATDMRYCNNIFFECLWMRRE